MTKSSATYWAKIYMAGDIAKATGCCQRFCDRVGLCVTIESCDYIYTKGREAGFVVGLICYPKFPAMDAQIWDKARRLANKLLISCRQESWLIMTPSETTWFTKRKTP